MTFVEFCLTVRTLGRIHGLSVMSWGRTVEHNRRVGGIPNSWHLDWLAVDVVLEDPRAFDAVKADAERLGLDVVCEADHVHLEPAGPSEPGGPGVA